MPNDDGKKRKAQTSVVRKAKQQRAAKVPNVQDVHLRSIAYLEKKLLMFPIDRQNFRVTSMRVPNDCFMCAIEYLKIITPKYSQSLKKILDVQNVGGVYIETMQGILTIGLLNTFKNIKHEFVTFGTLRYIREVMPNNTATIMGLYIWTGTKKIRPRGHIVLLIKDNFGNFGIFDAQSHYKCVTRQSCDDYLSDYEDHKILIFTAERFHNKPPVQQQYMQALV